jgi:gas vesicle protein
MSNQSGTVFLAGFILGGVVGTIFALLVAPQPGIETRTQIRNKSLELQEGLGEAGRRVQGQVASLQEKGQATLDWSKQSANEVVSRVKSTVGPAPDQSIPPEEVGLAGEV